MPRDLSLQENDQAHHIRLIQTSDGQDPKSLVIKDLTLKLPRSDINLVEAFSVALKRGDRFILTGPSGSGKSSVVRAIRNLWHNGNGDIEIPENANIFCLSQRVHIPRISLTKILCAPKPEGSFSEMEMDQILIDVGLEKLRNHLPINQANAKYLSGLCAPYVKPAIAHWDKKLARLSDTQRQQFIAGVRQYITSYADNFYPESLKPYINDALKKDLAEKITDLLEIGLSTQCGTGKAKSMNLINFGNGIEKLAASMGQYLLQASAHELALAYRDGRNFSRELSGGEQQKLAFAQLLLHKPDIAIMDEATSAMDPASTQKLYSLLVERLPETIVFGIAHNRDVIPFHTLHGHLNERVITVEPVR